MASRHYGEIEMLDYSESKSSFSFNFGAITAISLPGFLTNFGTLRTALAGITVGTISRERWVGDETKLSNIPPIDPNAQRELFWRVIYVASEGSNQGYQIDIATPDTSLLLAGSDRVDFANPIIATFITTLEEIAVSPNDEESGILVIDMKLMGRER